MMEDKRRVHESEYAVLSPIERHAKLVELYQSLPKSSPDAEWLAALDKHYSALKPHSEAFTKGLESKEEFVEFLMSDRNYRVNMDELRTKGDLERKTRSNSEEKKDILQKTEELLRFAPITDEFKQIIVGYFSGLYDDGADVLDNPIGLPRIVLVNEAQSGGFFNQQVAFNLEIDAYRWEKSGLEMGERWNKFLDGLNERKVLKDKELALMKADESEMQRRTEFVKKWEQAIKSRYQIEEI